MTDSDAQPPIQARTYRTARMEAFSDGVFAIATTLLVLEIDVPSGAEDDLLGALRDEWPSYLAYLVSFATIVAIWVAHTVVTEYLDHVTSVLVRLNLLLLMLVSFLPIPTKLLGDYIGESDPERVVTIIYGLNLLLVSALVSLLWRYAVRENLIKPDLADADRGMITRRLAPGLLGYVAMIVLAWFYPVLPVLGFLAIAVYILVPLGIIRRRRPSHTHKHA